MNKFSLPKGNLDKDDDCDGEEDELGKEKEEDDLTPSTKENLSLEDLKNTWISNYKNPVIFVSATMKNNVDEFREVLISEVKKLFFTRYPNYFKQQ